VFADLIDGPLAYIPSVRFGANSAWILCAAIAHIQRRTWLVLRTDPQHNVAAMAARDSVASALAAATKRLAYDLDGRRCAARPLTRDEFAEVDCAVLAGLQPTWSQPG
jgi:type VII secretion protein EccE